MNLRIVILVIGWLFSASLIAQDNVTAIEYYIDDDPGIGNGTSVSITSGVTQDVDVSISTTGLSVGFHEVVIRAQDAGGEWSVQQSNVFYVSAANVGSEDQVVMMEYFFDDDPGIGAGTAVDVTDGQSLDLDQVVTSSTLSSGFHTLSIRIQDENDLWSLPVSKSFFVLEADLAAQENISTIELFFDVDPGIGAAAAIDVTDATVIDLDQMVATDTLSKGFHTVTVRAQDGSGNWGLQKTQSFFLGESTSSSSNNLVSSIEYFIDIDPGVGAGTQLAIDPPAVMVDENLTIATSSLPNGTYTLGARVRDESDNYGVTETAEFIVCNSPTVSFSATTVCFGTPTDFTDLSTVEAGDLYSWDFDGDGNEDSSTAGDVSFAYPAAGTYTAILTIDRGGCADQSTVEINVEAIPVANAGSDQTVVVNQTTLDATAVNAGETGIWSIVSGVATIVADNDPASEVTDILSMEVVLRWTVTNDAAGCSDEDEVTITYNEPLSEDTDILTFVIDELTEPVIIDATTHTVIGEVARGTDLTALVPTVTVSDGATISPLSNVAQSFVSDVIYTVTAENGTTTQDWTVAISARLNDETDILSFDFQNIEEEELIIDASSSNISITVPEDVDVSALIPSIEVSEGATISPMSGIAQSFVDPVSYTVTAENGVDDQIWTVTVLEILSTDAEILSFTLAAQISDASIDAAEGTIMLQVEFGTDLTELDPEIIISDGAAIDPTGPQDFTALVIYTVTAEDGFTEREWVAMVEERPLGLSSNTIQVFPNPTREVIFIDGVSGDFQFAIMDVSGKIVLSGTNANQISLKELSPGIYSLELETEFWRETKRIIKH